MFTSSLPSAIMPHSVYSYAILVGHSIFTSLLSSALICDALCMVMPHSMVIPYLHHHYFLVSTIIMPHSYVWSCHTLWSFHIYIIVIFCYHHATLYVWSCHTLWSFHIYVIIIFSCMLPQWGAADAEIKVPSGENIELKYSPFIAWSR